jgi:hypothetical protein
MFLESKCVVMLVASIYLQISLHVRNHLTVKNYMNFTTSLIYVRRSVRQ